MLMQVSVNTMWADTSLCSKESPFDLFDSCFFKSYVFWYDSFVILWFYDFLNNFTEFACQYKKD